MRRQVHLKNRKGYTLVEVALVIVITAILFMAFIGTVGSRIASQRYSDATGNFAEFLRSTYSTVIAVQNNGSGNSSQAIYGKVITFGEGGSRTIFSYDVLGKAVSGDQISSGSGVLAALRDVEVNVFSESGDIINKTSYDLPHGAWLETTAPREGYGTGDQFEGTLLIVRSPASGAVTTMFLPKALAIQDSLKKGSNDNPLRVAINTSLSNPNNPDIAFHFATVDFCVASDDQDNPNIRRDVRLAIRASGSSAVNVINQESEDNKCSQ